MKSSSLSAEVAKNERVAFLIEGIEAELVLLRELHILSQTESLILENDRMEDLAEIVSQKEVTVARLSELTELLTPRLQAVTRLLASATFQERQSLAFLKTEGMQLLHQIQRIDSSNRLRLEEFRNQSIQSSHQIQQEKLIHRAYDSVQLAASGFSELAD